MLWNSENQCETHFVTLRNHRNHFAFTGMLQHHEQQTFILGLPVGRLETSKSKLLPMWPSLIQLNKKIALSTVMHKLKS